MRYIQWRTKLGKDSAILRYDMPLVQLPFEDKPIEVHEGHRGLPLEELMKLYPRKKPKVEEPSPVTLDCPYCGHGHRLDDIDIYECITSYYGGTHEFTCSGCDSDFVVKETVERTWDSLRDEEEAPDD